MVVLARVAAAGRGLYIPLLPSPASRILLLKILHLCHLGVTKSACPTDAEKCPPTAICPHSRWRSQPFPASAGSKGITH